MADGERNYYCYCENGCKFPTMTKEQILAAITQAVETGEVKDIDTGFITRIKEINKGVALYFWVGTTAEYNALTEIYDDCHYIKTDDTTKKDFEAAVDGLRKSVEELQKKQNEFGVVLYENSDGVKPEDETTGESGAIILDLNTVKKYSVFAVTVQFGLKENVVVCGKETSDYGNIAMFNDYVAITGLQTTNVTSNEDNFIRVLIVCEEEDGCRVREATFCDAPKILDATKTTDGKIIKIVGLM